MLTLLKKYPFPNSRGYPVEVWEQISNSSHDLLTYKYLSMLELKLNRLHLVPHIYASVNWAALVQVMACRLFSTKPLPEPMLTYSQLDP